MKKGILLFLLLITAAIAYSQTAEELEEMSKAKLASKDYKYALMLVDKAIVLEDKNVWLYILKADIEYNYKRFDDAISTLQKAIMIDPKEPESYNRAGMYLSSAGFSDEAVNYFNEAINRAGEDSIKNSYLVNRGTAFGAIQEFDKAIKDFEQVLQNEPENVGAINNVAAAYKRIGENAKAIKMLEKMINLDSTFIGSYVNLGFTYSGIDSFDKAIKYFEKALVLSPDEPLTLNNLGYVYYRKGNYIKALSLVNQSISFYPSNSYAYRNLGLIYIATNNLHEACNALKYAESQNFQQRYGDEVNELLRKHCK